jgi:hypothetical protein
VAVATEEQRTDQISAKKRELRIQSTAGYRLADKHGMSELIYTHIALRVPGPKPTFLGPEAGMRFTMCNAEAILLPGRWKWACCA